MSILIKTVRISGFRGLKNIEVELEKTTVLTGMNNSGKTSFLKALQLALGNRLFLSQDDFYIQGNEVSEKIIIIDLLIIPVDENSKKTTIFSDDWETLLTINKIRTDDSGSFVALRTIITSEPIKNNYKTQQYILPIWSDFEKEDKTSWFQSENGNETVFRFEEIPFFYMDAQRDILEDIKLKNSYLGKMLDSITYSKEAVNDIEAQIKLLNETAVNNSDILSTIKTTLKELDTAMDSDSEGIDITPFTKKLRDLNKGLSIYYADQKDSFPMEYHGMGTRSWSSLLTLKSFISLSENNDSLFFPISAIEEPEAHLHPNAQKKLYAQINSIAGQKIISTHSPYIAASADLKQIRSFYKDNDAVRCGKIKTEQLTSEDIRKINRQVINTRGELFFSKVLVLSEGDTEEQALPILAENYFFKSPVEIGIDFVGIGGYGNYLPFIRFAESLNIPWIIFSDNDQNGEVKNSVNKQFINSKSKNNENDCVLFLDNGNDFEKQLIHDGFSDEIKKAILSLKIYNNKHHENHQKPIDEADINLYDDGKLYEVITNDKTKFAPIIAEEINSSSKLLPPKIIDLFDKIKMVLSSKEAS